jgi:hypothetical protein
MEGRVCGGPGKDSGFRQSGATYEQDVSAREAYLFLLCGVIEAVFFGRNISNFPGRTLYPGIASNLTKECKGWYL